MFESLLFYVESVRNSVGASVCLLESTFGLYSCAKTRVCISDLVESIQRFLRYCQFVEEVKAGRLTVKKAFLKYRDLDTSKLKDITSSAVCQEYTAAVMLEFVK